MRALPDLRRSQILGAIAQRARLGFDATLERRVKVRLSF